MSPTHLLTFLTWLLLVGSPARPLFAAEANSTEPANVVDTRKERLDTKATRLVAALKIEDNDKASRAKDILGEWLVTLTDWHRENDPALKDLWAQWSLARAVVPKDEFPAEVIAHRIDDLYASLQPAYQAFVAKLSTELTAGQIDTLKELWSRSPGMKRTYNSYLEIVPDLTEAQKQVIQARMHLAREAAMLTDADKEIINIFKRHKVKVEAYVGTLAWAKLHAAYATRDATPPAAPVAPVAP